MDVAVRDARPGDEPAWRRLWAGYLAFYEAAVPEATTAATWARILDPASPIHCRIAERDGAVIGFATHVLHEGTWATRPLCYLEDLFVDAAVRGSGAGRALIDDLLALGRARGWDRVYWHTHHDNATARRLYDSYRPANGMIVYQVDL
jgi:GNAT superfamily N-acetyltransferase